MFFSERDELFEEVEDMTTDDRANWMIKMGILTNNEWNLICDIFGKKDEYIDDILYAREGFSDFESFYVSVSMGEL